MTYMIGEEIWRIGAGVTYLCVRERSKTAKIAEEKRKNEEEEEGSAYVLKINRQTVSVGIRSVLF